MSPKLYDELASWWPLLSAPEDYAEEAEFYRSTLTKSCAKTPSTMLELGSGGGNNASHMKSYVDMTLVDLSVGMLAVSRELNPECVHIQGDMRTVRLDREFDCVFVHDAVCYMVTESDLAQVVETAYVHCADGGAVLFAPDHVRETFAPSTEHGGHDGETGGLRYLEWAWDPNPDDTTYAVDYAYLLRAPDGSMTVEYDRHVEGLFSKSDWLRILSDGGFEATVLPLVHSEFEDREFFVFVGKKPRRAR